MYPTFLRLPWTLAKPTCNSFPLPLLISGICNMAVTAARLELLCVAIGHVANAIYGQFPVDVLNDERIRMVGTSEGTDVLDSSSTPYETLLCWVLVNPLHGHDFRSWKIGASMRCH